MPAKEPYFPAEEPYMPAKAIYAGKRAQYLCERGPYIFVKTKSPVSLQKSRGPFGPHDL